MGANGGGRSGSFDAKLVYSDTVVAPNKNRTIFVGIYGLQFQIVLLVDPVLAFEKSRGRRPRRRSSNFWVAGTTLVAILANISMRGEHCVPASGSVRAQGPVTIVSTAVKWQISLKRGPSADCFKAPSVVPLPRKTSCSILGTR